MGPFSTATAAVFVRYSTFTGRAQRCGGFHYWRNTTNCYSCSWFCTILLEFYSMFLCKILFSSSSKVRLPFSVLQENKTLYLESANGRSSVKKMFFCHVSMMWTLVDLFCSKKLFPQKNAFFPRLFYRRWERKEFVLLGIQLFFYNKWIQNCDSLQDTQLFDRAPQGTGQL